MEWLYRLSIAVAVACTAACSTPVTGEPGVMSDGKRVHVPIGMVNQLSLEPPKGARRLDAQTWLWSFGANRTVVLRAQQNAEPEGGAMAYVDRQIAEMNQGGEAGVERDETLLLGDLEARRVDAVELRQKPPTSLWLVIATAEDGMFVISAAGPRDEMRAHSQELDAFLRSVRILAPSTAQTRAASEPAGADIAAPAAASVTDDDGP